MSEPDDYDQDDNVVPLILPGRAAASPHARPAGELSPIEDPPPRRRRLTSMLRVRSERLPVVGEQFPQALVDIATSPSEAPEIGQRVADLVGPVYEGELVDDDPAPVPVDQAAAAVPSAPPWQRLAERRPLVPAWLADPQERRQARDWALGHVTYTAQYHGVRLPVYAARLAGRAPRGIGRGIGSVYGWLTDAESAPLRQSAAGGGATADYLSLAKRRDDRVRARAVQLCLLLAVGLPLAALVWIQAGGKARAVLVVALVLLAGVAGRRRDKPIVSRAVTAPARVERLTSDIVERGLRATGVGALGKGTVSFVAPIVRDGPGWRAEVDLPHGTTAAEVMEKRDKLAAGLRRPLGCVWPEPLARVHPGRLVVWVGDEDMATAKAPAWPLAKTGQVDLFQPVPFGNDQRGRLVVLLLMFASVLIGAMPRMGKTFALRVLLLAAALDPRAELWLYELKGTGDLSPLEPVAHRYTSGFTGEAIAAALDGLRAIMALLEVRAATINGLPREVCPESKVTPELASNRRLGLYPIVLAIDECQELFGHPDHGKEAGELATRIIKLGPALGVMLLLGTQRPDAQSLPTGISANAGIRFCLRVMGQTENDMVLGTSSYKNGLRATTFTKDDRGIGYLIGGEGADAQIARSSYLDGPAADLIVARARSLREAAGTLSGHALGEAVEPAAGRRSVVADLALVFGADEAQAHSDVLCARLGEQWPSTYTGWKPAQLTAALKPYQVATRQVWAEGRDGKPANRRGLARADVLAAAGGDG